MVLFKRKPVQYLPNPQIEDDNTDVWVIGQTGEIFTLYEAYLQRMDFYKQRRFICDITGHSGLDFFEALKSEIHGAKDVDRSFPEPLREPVLRKVQFSTISRIDSLVDWIFDEFKQDFYPGETVTVLVASGQRLNGIVREKTRFTEIRGVDGFVERRGFSRYFVALINRPEEEALVDDDHIMRDRKAFTKQILRSYIKNTVTRESWTGAPWLVKDHIAKKFRIETEVPSHLRQESKIAEKKAQLAQKRGEQNTKSLAAVSPNARLTDLKPSSKSHKSKQQQQVSKSKNAQSKDLQNGNTNGKKGTHSAEQVQFIHTNFPASDSTAARDPVKPPQPPPIKYPIEDLDIPIEFDPALSRRRPPLKFIAPVEPGPVPSKGPTNAHEFSAEAVGLLLETWDTLNVYCEVFVLDSFTFDDFVDALKISSDDVECELFVEMHCAVLKILVDDESAGGKIQVMLPAMPEEEYSEEEDSVQDSTAPPSPTPEPEPVVRASRRTTRSSLAAAEADKAANRSRSGSRETATHRAVEMLADYSWADRLRKRDFKLGGWETIMVGLLYQLSLKKQNESACETILRELAPIDMEATQETARYQYANLNCNLRIKALQMICMLTMETKVVRAYLEECGEESTGIRRERVELQRKRKMLLEELRPIDEERKALLPSIEVPNPEPANESNGDVSMTGTGDTEVDPESLDDLDDELPHKGRSLRRGDDRAAERKRKREEEREKKERAEAAVKPTKEAKLYKRLTGQMEEKQAKIKDCESEMARLDDELREADCPRTRCLGKDRFWNRYWWFERNGMPYAGLPDSSTAEAGYANGRIWVQGPDADEYEGFINLKGHDAAQYLMTFHLSVLDRKLVEEQGKSVFNARQWGFIDEPEDVDKLIGYLDVRGDREVKLRKELQLQRDIIVAHMARRKAYLDPAREMSTEDPPARMSTRTKHQVDHSEPRCLSWRNTTALSELGRLHSEAPRPRKTARKSEPKGGVERVTRGIARTKNGKPTGRQGTRYTF